LEKVKIIGELFPVLCKKKKTFRNGLDFFDVL